MIWYTWPSEADFDVWHQQVITALNLPRVGVNAATGEPRPDAQQTTAYTSVIEVAEGDWRAPVDMDIALAHPTGLGVVSEPPPEPELV